MVYLYSYYACKETAENILECGNDGQNCQKFFSGRNEAEKFGNCEIKIGNIKFIEYRKKKF